MFYSIINKQPTVIVSKVMSVLLIIVCIWFWYWLIGLNEFAVGKVTEILVTKGSFSVLILENLLETSAVAISQSELTNIKLNDWVLVYGIEYDDEAELLVSYTIFSKKIVTTLFSVEPLNWLNYLVQNHYLSILVAGVFIILSGRIFQFCFSLIMTVFLLVTFWHAGTIANEMGLLNMDIFELYSLMGIVTIFGLWAYRLNDGQEISSRLVASFFVYLFGKQILTWFGFQSEMANLLLFISALFSPVIVSSLFAGYLLSHALNSSTVGGYILISFALLLSLGFLGRNSHYQYAVRLKKYFSKKSALNIDGKVTLVELINIRNNAS